jgi:hypothetical protein
MLLQRYDSLRPAACLLLASKTLPGSVLALLG